MIAAKTKIKLAIYSIALLMMGAVGISGGLAVIGEHFSGESQTMIQNLISVPCMVIIPTTLLVGKLMERFSKKSLAVFGAACFLTGGVAPVFLTELGPILVMRGILGAGVGISQVVSTALVAEYFSGPEQNKVQGVLQASQMAGLAVMMFAGGALADIRWNLTFYVHVIAVVTLVFCLTMLAAQRPVQMSPESRQKVHLTRATLMWTVFTFVLFLAVQIYSISLSFFVAEFGLGTAVDAGLSLAFFAVGGIVMGVLYGTLARVLKTFTVAFGCLLMAVSYLVIAYSGSIATCHIGSFLFGLALSAVMPGLFVNASTSVDAYSAAMAISVVTCAQNFAQFLSPYLLNPLARAAAGDGSANFAVFVIAAVIAAALFVFMLVRGVCESRKMVEKL